ncbi:MAG: acyl-CoA thioesterase [Pelagimonas sp.]|jgi:4-hydroxybenzoyl-CoA thioesterase|nr:acyl-CoA thioesterase [Pelagimonas sp.]
MEFIFPQKVLFKHCDPAGIVFYPRYFEMINDCTEAFFDQALGCPFETLLQEAGVPTVQINTGFQAPSRHGDALILTLRGDGLGRSHFTQNITATCDGQTRFTCQSTLVYTTRQGQPQPWPDTLRHHLAQFTGETP